MAAAGNEADGSRAFATGACKTEKIIDRKIEPKLWKPKNLLENVHGSPFPIFLSPIFLSHVFVSSYDVSLCLWCNRSYSLSFGRHAPKAFCNARRLQVP